MHPFVHLRCASLGALSNLRPRKIFSVPFSIVVGTVYAFNQLFSRPCRDARLWLRPEWVAWSLETKMLPYVCAKLREKRLNNAKNDTQAEGSSPKGN